MSKVSTIRTVTARVFILIQSLGRQTVFGQLGPNPRHKAAALATHLAVAAGLPATTEPVDVEVVREVFHFTHGTSYNVSLLWLLRLFLSHFLRA